MSINNYLPTVYQQYIYLSRYARWLPEEKRRETWAETVGRYFDFFEEHLKDQHKHDIKSYRKEVEEAVLSLKVMPSMRCMMTAGEALKRENVAGYNCSFTAVNRPQAFDEILYVLMNGTGVGFSVENKEVEKLPVVAETFNESDTTIVVADSKLGWAKALKELIGMLYVGQVPKWDVSKVRPAGAPLKTFGGRASGPDPLVSLFKFCVDIFKKSAGRKLTSLECHDIVCKIAEIVVVGGVRRSALISLSDLSDDRLRHAKSGQWWLGDVQRALANNSAVYASKPDIGIFMDEWKALYESKSGERGIFNRQSAKKTIDKFGRRNSDYDFGVNPCLTGDTLVAVADGRNLVTIKELAEAGEDVPVYTKDFQNNVTVRYMRNPRITGYNTPVYEILLDDGNKIKATHNHKFLTTSGKYVMVSDLKYGDSLALMTKYQTDQQNRKYSKNYWDIRFKTTRKMEHRIFSEFYFDRKIMENEIVHHKDHNGLNNKFENLEIMDFNDHVNYHKQFMLGDLNPMRRAENEWSEQQWFEYRQKQRENNIGEKNKNYSGITHEDLKYHALELTKLLGYRFSVKDWQKYANEKKIPLSFSGWRQNHLGNIISLSKWAAYELGLDNNISSSDPRTQRKYLKYLNDGYNVEINNNRVIFNKNCEHCGTHFTTPKREVGFCSVSCHNCFNYMNMSSEEKEQRKEKMLFTWELKKEQLREKQTEIFSNLKFKMGREPSKKEWIKECKSQNISFEISRKTSPFRRFVNLKEASTNYNHKIVSIKYIGEETVYNGTVDEFHNFFVGGFESTTKDNKIKLQFINNLQCGEILLRDREFCNLTEVVIRGDDTEKDIAEKIRVATILGTWQSTLTNFRYLSKKWEENCKEERLLGVSFTGIMDNEITNGKKSGLPERLEKWRQIAVETNKELAKKIGIPHSVAITCGKPSGTVSQLVDAASGIHARHNPYYIRTVRADKKDPLAKMMVDMGFPAEDDVTKPAHTYVFSFPIKAPDGAVFRQDMGAIEQLELWLVYKQHFTEHNPSVTISVKENEWLDVAAWVYKNFDYMTGVSFLPYSDHVYQQAPFQDCSKEEYQALLNKMPKNVDWAKLSQYETVDTTTGVQELSCTAAGGCEI